MTPESVKAEAKPSLGVGGSAVRDIMEEYCRQSTRVEVPHIASPEVGPGGGVLRSRRSWWTSRGGGRAAGPSTRAAARRTGRLPRSGGGAGEPSQLPGRGFYLARLGCMCSLVAFVATSLELPNEAKRLHSERKWCHDTPKHPPTCTSALHWPARKS